ncbi:hypothetical protein KUTeg_014373 [Tegillarca granosa]|uniref:COMM domain-containing protein 1 n=1 Tax=Tegillarca granosa TaxID=220873 RepID=A0ABQ9EWD1_TEGGR|nr:hypothetical protein KUTeg_014373 [Tegillarca granosa]
MAEDSKNLLALLNGVAKRTYYNETEFTDEFLKSQIYPDIAEDDFQAIVSKFTGLIKSMVSADMDFNQLEAFLTSQIKKREGALTEDQANVLRRFWKSHKNKIHDSIISQTKWNNSLKQVSWRIDVKSQAKNIEQINEPTAIVELHISKPNTTKETDTVRFEMDEKKLAGVLQNMKDIEDEIAKYCQD